MTDEELCKALRSALWGQGHHINIKAADRIEALTEQLEAARADAKEAEAYAEGLEAKLAKAVEAKQPASDAGPCVCFACLEARALLAEIEGTDAP